jgi:hypothetical protein
MSTGVLQPAGERIKALLRGYTRAADIDVKAWNAGHPRHPKGPDGKWADVPDAGVAVVANKLKGAGRVDLEPGERLLKSDRMKGENGRAWLAVIEKDGKKSLRLGLGNANFGTRHDHGGPWRAGPDRTAEIDAERAELRADIEELEDELEAAEADPETDPRSLEERRAQLEDLYGAESGVGELPGGSTAMLDEGGARQLREALAKGLDDGKKLQAELDRPYAELDRLTNERDRLKLRARGRKFTDEEDAEWDRLTAAISRAQAELDPTSGPERPESGYWTFAEGSIPGQWADVHYDIYLDDPSVGVEVKLGAVPHGSDMDFDDMRGAEMTASFDIVEADELVRLLANLDTAPSRRATRSGHRRNGPDMDVSAWNAANPDNPRDGEGKFTDGPGGAVVSATADALDKLKLAKRAPAGFTVRSSKKIKTDYADVGVAEVDSPDGPQIRVGVIAGDRGKWDAGFTGEGRKTELRKQIAEKRAVFESDDDDVDVPGDIEDQIGELESELENLENERTAVLTPAAMADFRRRLGEGLEAAKANKAKVDADIKASEAIDEKRDALIAEFSDAELEKQISETSWRLREAQKTVKRLEHDLKHGHPRWSPELVAELLANWKAHVVEYDAELAPMLARRAQIMPPDARVRLEDLDRQYRELNDPDIDDILTSFEVSTSNGTRLRAEIWGSDDEDEQWVKTYLYVLAPGETTDDADSGDGYGWFRGLRGLNKLIAGLGESPQGANSTRSAAAIAASIVDTLVGHSYTRQQLRARKRWLELGAAPAPSRVRAAGVVDEHGNLHSPEDGKFISKGALKGRTGVLGSVLDKLDSLREKLGDDDRSVLDEALARLRGLESSDVDDDDLVEDEPDEEDEDDDEEDDDEVELAVGEPWPVETNQFHEASVTLGSDGEVIFDFDGDSFVMTPDVARNLLALLTLAVRTSPASRAQEYRDQDDNFELIIRSSGSEDVDVLRGRAGTPYEGVELEMQPAYSDYGDDFVEWQQALGDILRLAERESGRNKRQFVRHPAKPPHEQWMHAGQFIKKLFAGRKKAADKPPGLDQGPTFEPIPPLRKRGMPRSGQVRPELSSAQSAAVLNRLAAEEARRITGRDIAFDLEGADLQIGREYAEGVLRAIERYPSARLSAVRIGDPAEGVNRDRDDIDVDHIYARTLLNDDGGHELVFDRGWSSNPVAFREALAASAHRRTTGRGGVTSDPMGLAIHELAHVIDTSSGNLLSRIAQDMADRFLASRGEAPYRGNDYEERLASRARREMLVSGDVSSYATASWRELAAEAFADVEVNGDDAGELSRAIIDAFEDTNITGKERDSQLTGSNPALREELRHSVSKVLAAIAGATPGRGAPSVLVRAADLNVAGWNAANPRNPKGADGKWTEASSIVTPETPGELFRWFRQSRDPLGIIEVPGVHGLTGSARIGDDDSFGVNVYGDEGAVVIGNGTLSDGHRLTSTDELAVLGTDQIQKTRAMLRKAIHAAGSGGAFDAVVEGDDVGDLRISVDPGQRRVKVSAYSWSTASREEDAREELADLRSGYEDHLSGWDPVTDKEHFLGRWPTRDDFDSDAQAQEYLDEAGFDTWDDFEEFAELNDFEPYTFDEFLADLGREMPQQEFDPPPAADLAPSQAQDLLDAINRLTSDPPYYRLRQALRRGELGQILGQRGHIGFVRFDPDQPRVPDGPDAGQWMNVGLGGLLSKLYPDGETLVVGEFDDGNEGYVTVFSDGQLVVSVDQLQRPGEPKPERKVVSFLDADGAREVADRLDTYAEDADGFEDEDGEYEDISPDDSERTLIDHSLAADGQVVVGYNPENWVVVGWAKEDVAEPDPAHLDRDFDYWSIDPEDARRLRDVLTNAADRRGEAVEEEADTYSAGDQFDLIRYADGSFGFWDGADDSPLQLSASFAAMRQVFDELVRLRDAGGGEGRSSVGLFDFDVDADGNVKVTKRPYRQEITFKAGTLDGVIDALDDGLDAADYEGRRKYLPPELAYPTLAARMAVSIVDTLLGGRYTPQQHRARKAWLGRCGGQTERFWRPGAGVPFKKNKSGQWVDRYGKFADLPDLIKPMGGPKKAGAGQTEPAAVKTPSTAPARRPRKLRGDAPGAIARIEGLRQDPSPDAGEQAREVLAVLSGPQLKLVADHFGFKLHGRLIAEKRQRLEQDLFQDIKVGGKEAAAGEPLRPDGDEALAQVPAGRVRPDDGPDGVLRPAGSGDRRPDRRPRRPVGAAAAAGSAVPAADAADDGRTLDGGQGSAGGDAAEGRGRRDRRVVFRPRGQEDLAPATAKKRLAANLEALRTLRAIGTPGALQLVFSDIGTPAQRKAKRTKGKAAQAAGGEPVLTEDQTGYFPEDVDLSDFNAYDALRDKLVARGIPRAKIRFIHEAKTDQEKAELFAAARDGRIAVLIGSTNKMGVGTNVQDRAVALHHLDAPWRPADVQQREGRIIRQGNKNPEVRVIRYVTEGSFDAYIWQAITTKGTFINQIMRGRADVREMDDVGDFALSAAEVTALGTGNRWLIEHAEARADLTRLERALRNHEADQRNLARQISAAEADINLSEKTIKQAGDALATRVDTRGDNFRIGLVDTDYTDRPDAQARLRQILRKVARGDDLDSTIGDFAGFPLRASPAGDGVELELLGAPGVVVAVGRAEIADGDIIGKLQARLGNLEKLRAHHVARLAEARQDVESLQARVGKPFRDADALSAARDRFERVERELRAELASRGQTLEPEDPVAKAAARKAAEIAGIRDRLDAGEGFAGVGELTSWLEADPELAKEIPNDSGAKWGVLTPRGQLLVMKDPRGGYMITIPRSMRTLKAISDMRTQRDAKKLAELLEASGIPWNTSTDLNLWRAPDGRSAAEVAARLRSEHKDLDKNGTWAQAADRMEAKRLMPQRLHEPLLEGQYRHDGLGMSNFLQIPRGHREEILAILRGSDPDSDLQTAARLREYVLDSTDHYTGHFAVGAAQRIEQDYRQRHPQPLDPIRKRLETKFDRIEYKWRERARIDRMLADADRSGDFAGAATELRKLIDDFDADRYGYGNQSVIDLAGDLAAALDELADRELVGARGVAASQARALLSAFTRHPSDAMREEIAGWVRAAGADTHPGGEELHHYWTKDPEGLAKWATLKEGRWTALYEHLKHHMPDWKAKKTASAWFLEVIGYAAGSDQNRVASGKPPRGEKIGPG